MAEERREARGRAKYQNPWNADKSSLRQRHRKIYEETACTASFT